VANGKGGAILRERFRPVYVQSMAAVTPEYASADALWEAWISGGKEMRPRLPGAGAWGRLTGAAIEAALAGAGVEGRACSLILATTKGDIERQVAWMRGADAIGAEKLDWPVPTLSQALVQMIESHGFRPPCYTVSTACSSGIVALIEAALLVQSGDAEAVLALGADVAGDFVMDGFGALKAVTATRCRPFDRGRDGLMLGSGAAACVVSGRPAEVAIVGVGIANDATHMTAPDREAGGLIRAIAAALESAGLEAGAIDAIVAHGTGTKYNDAMEATAFSKIFGGRATITGIKGLIGHTLGASGLMESVMAMRMLREQVVPAVTGLQDPEMDNLNFVVNQMRPMKLRHVLKVASGFGGMNAAIVLKLEGAG